MFDVKQNVIEGCYGNHNTDTQAYMDAGVMPKIIYLVNNQGKLVNAATGLKTTYQEQIAKIDSLYPPTWVKNLRNYLEFPYKLNEFIR